MVLAFCTRCERQVGGYWRPPALQCVKCRNFYCDTCPRKRIGRRFFSRLACPECGVELRDMSHVSVDPKRMSMS